MSRDMRYVLIPENLVSREMLENEMVSPFGDNLVGNWSKLRRVTEATVLKCVIKFDVSCGIPKEICAYITAASPTVYDSDTVGAALEALDPGGV